MIEDNSSFKRLKNLNNLAKVSLGIFGFVVLYFFYIGVTTTPEQISEVDSLVYHIPIAKNITQGRLFNPPGLPHGLGFYPGVGESILSVFISLGIPLNLFNVLGLIILFVLCFSLGKGSGLYDSAAIVFASSVSLLNSAIRLILNQTIDIWLAIFFLSSLYLLERPKGKLIYFIKLGISLGLLIGVKYSGIFFALVLLLLYGKNLLKIVKIDSFLAIIFPIFIFGLSWYLRNYLITGNPIYPVNLLGFYGHPDFRTQDVNTIKTLLDNSRFFWVLLQALISEYLIWSLALILVPLIALKSRKLSNDLNRLAILGICNFLIFLFLPSWPENIVSDLRYLYPSIIPTILAVFLIAKRFGLLEKLQILAVLNSAAVLPQLSFRPKLILIWLLIYSLLFLKLN